jgi:hypothetical protein
MSRERDTIPAPPIDPDTGEAVTYEQLATRFDGIDMSIADFKKVVLQHFFDTHQRLDADARESRELLNRVLELSESNRKRIDMLEEWREERELRNGAHHS